MVHFADISPGERVLQVGCGMGRYTFILAQREIQVKGLDLTPGLLPKFRAFDRERYNIPLYCTDVIDHPLELDNRFDAVIGFFYASPRSRYSGLLSSNGPNGETRWTNCIFRAEPV